ncbi:hypothetical protein D9M70_537530 [compost metagenome]
MSQRSFDRAQCIPVGNKLSIGRKFGFHDARTERSEGFNSPFKCCRVVCIDASERVFAIKPDTQVADTLSNLGHVVRHGGINGSGIILVPTGNRLKNRSRVRRRAGHGSQVVEAGCQLKYPAPTDASPSWLDPGQPARCRRQANRSPRIGTDRTEAEACRSCHTRTRRGRPNPIVFIPRVRRVWYIRVVASVGAFGHR